MYSFDLSTKTNLPPTERWLRAPTVSPAEIEVRGWVGLPVADIVTPDEWRSAYADYAYEFPELQALKANLNTVKRRMDAINADPAASRRFSQLSNILRPHEALRGRQGILVQQYGAEIVTNAWLKMYETMPLFKQVLDAAARAAYENRILRSFHVAEAPGNFMLAINHYIASHYGQLRWSWYANSYRQIWDDGARIPKDGYLGDDYGLMARYPRRWLYGADGNGDITSVANIRSFRQELLSGWGTTADLFTSDVKYVPDEMNYDEEERINIPVHTGHLVAALNCLRKGGAMLLKQFTLFEAPSVSLLYLMSCCFTELRVIKPETSRPGNSEIYIVGLKYKENLSEAQLARLADFLSYVRPLATEDGSPSLFRVDDIPLAFYNKVRTLGGQLAGTQITQMQTNFAQMERLATPNQIRDEMESRYQHAADDWIRRNPIVELPTTARMVQRPRENRWRK